MPPRATGGSGHGDEEILRAILEGTAAKTGEAFFQALVRSAADALGVAGVWVTELIDDGLRLRALAFWLRDSFVEHYEYDIRGTPCDPVVREHRCVHVPDRVVQLFPEDPDLAPLGAVSYLGYPLEDDAGVVLGHLAVLHDSPLPKSERNEALLRIFAARAGAELQRIRAEQAVREREEELAALVDSAMDAVISLDSNMTILRANPAASSMFGKPAISLKGADVSTLFTLRSRLKLRRLMEDLDSRPLGHRSSWIAGGMDCVRSAGRDFPAEGTLSRMEVRGRASYLLILRDISARIEAERKLEELAAESDYLREEIRALQGGGDIPGESEQLLRVLGEGKRVAETDATVLLLGETGTGKEVVARAIHSASPRSSRPLVRVNCGAIPATLIESELFGHEKGAFTGATSKRAGRFALADGGTIFLDEVGELPLDLQPKLLRVLQEGEFEPVGSERTRTVNVRVIAATNRDLEELVRQGRFREDLYYRLNVVPLRLPPLRERAGDIVLLARAFLNEFAQRHGRSIHPLTAEDLAILRGYPWPGNVRELRNVIERAVITSRDGRLNLARVLGRPGSGGAGTGQIGTSDEPSAQDTKRVLSAEEFKALERENMLRALTATGWQISGAGGASALLGIPASTLASRIRALGLERPRVGIGQ